MREWKGSEGFGFGHVKDVPPMRQPNRHARLVVAYKNLEFRAEL